MALEVDKVILIPRFTAFAGVGTYYTVPVNVHEYATASLMAWRAKGNGASPTFSVQVQTSPDLQLWANLGNAVDPGDDGELEFDIAMTREWLRLAVTLAGTKPAFTSWCVGNFVRRES